MYNTDLLGLIAIGLSGCCTCGSGFSRELEFTERSRLKPLLPGRSGAVVYPAAIDEASRPGVDLSPVDAGPLRGGAPGQWNRSGCSGHGVSSAPEPGRDPPATSAESAS